MDSDGSGGRRRVPCFSWRLWDSGPCIQDCLRTHSCTSVYVVTTGSCNQYVFPFFLEEPVRISVGSKIKLHTI